VNVSDVRVVQRGKRLRLAREPGQSVIILREGLREYLDGDLAIEPRIARAIDLAHTSCT
jgi:hypothetical protein